MLKHTASPLETQENVEKSSQLLDLCGQFLAPLFQKLDRQFDSRMMNTFVGLLLAITLHRDRHQGLVVSELGGELLGEAQAPAGAKRIRKLLHSPRWKADQMESELWRQADEQVDHLTNTNEDALVIWDESEVEKPESLKAERLCPVRSSKARRLQRIKPGFYNPPGGRPICVPGFHWLQVVVTGMKGAAHLARLHWWTSRGAYASDKRTEEWQVLSQAAKSWGQRVVHVFDQGFAGAPWLGWLVLFNLRFVLRWKKSYDLIGPDGQVQSASQMVAWKRPQDHRMIWDAPHHCWREVGILFRAVRHPEFPDMPLWLVVSRPGSGRKPWFLLTSEPIHSTQDAWRIVFVYARRWQIEMTLRFEKSELGFESPRLLDWEARRKLLLMASLVHAFLIFLLAPRLERLKLWLLNTWCKRNGQWSQETPTPLYRLRLALAHLWHEFHPIPILC